MLSVVIPTFNEERYLPRRPSALRQQTYPDYEIDFADAGSTDSTCRVARGFGCRVVEEGRPPPGL
jgi:glycosyltransferase involved in cell wall biosynthesis